MKLNRILYIVAVWLVATRKTRWRGKMWHHAYERATLENEILIAILSLLLVLENIELAPTGSLLVC